ncbi:MAG: exodeoxyribonuclease V subunit gamma [Acidobacteria bacterium]|nr:exodeoxyribonuclease V subunit gamma [Acidobacteriota bacterium]
MPRAAHTPLEAGLFLRTSNDLNALADRLARMVAEAPLGDPLRPEIVVVPTRGMGRWLSLRLARATGVCAHTRFIFPNRLVTDVLRPLVPEADDPAPFDRDNLTWAVADLLRTDVGLAERPETAPIRQYIGGSELRLYQLASRIADTFDQYLVYRPDFIRAWETGGRRLPGDADEAWQALVWRALLERLGGGHRLRLQERLLACLERGPRASVAALAERVSVFGLPTLPPYHLAVLAALARHVPVYIHLLTPSAEYWGDLRSERERRRLRGGRPADPELDREFHLEARQPLLEAWGKTGRDFLEALLDLDAQAEELFPQRERRHLLGRLQADLEQLVNRGRGKNPEAAPLPVAPDDRSIRVVSCHSLMREAEVLHDHLLDCFATLPDLAPGDILVLAPDIETYAPYLRAVFDSVPPGRRIPYTITDRSPRRESPVAEAFLTLLRLADSRFTAPDVLALLEFVPVRERFALTADDLERIRGWLVGANIRWGLDGPSKERLGLPPEPTHTWRAGLDRLLLGYALPPEADALFGGIAPAAGVEGDGAAVLGRLAELVAAFGRLARTLDGSVTRREWARRLAVLLDEFFVRSEDVDRETECLLAAIHDLGELPGLGDEGPAYGLDAVRHSLEETLGQPAVEFGFLTGRVTCCSMVPMRSIPFRVIALLGLNDAEFPRQAPECGFDLMRREHRILDRSRRDEDRYLFLESLLSARDVFYISYIGRHARDNSALQPAVVVSQLIDYIDQGYRFPDAGRQQAPGDEPPVPRLVVEHPLQPFSERYFTGPPGGALFTFSEAAAQAAGRGPAAAPAVPSRLPPAGPEWRVMTPGQLTEFFRNPAKFLLVNRLQARFEREEAEPSGEEPFALDSLAKYCLKDAVLTGLAIGADPGPTRARLQAAGELPPGTAGQVAFAELWREAVAIRERVAQAQGDAETESMAVELALPGPDGPLTIRGAVGGVSGGTLLRVRPGAIRAVDRLSLWVELLLLSAAHPDRVSRGVFIGMKKKDVDHWSIAPIPDPAAVLARLLEVFWEGVHGFIPFAPRSSEKFAAEFRKQGDTARAMRAAQDEWLGGYRKSPEADDFCLRLALDRLGVFASEGGGVHEEFARLALTVFEPLLDSGEETR